MALSDVAANALHPQAGGPPPPGAPAPPGAGAPPQQGGQPPLRAVAEAYARCEQTKSCTPQDLQVLKAGLPLLVQMVQNIQKIIQLVSQGGQQQQQPPGGGAPPPSA